MNIYPSTIHQSWDDFLTKDIQDRIIQISHEIGEKINPEPSRVLKFLEMDFCRCRNFFINDNQHGTHGFEDFRRDKNALC